MITTAEKIKRLENRFHNWQKELEILKAEFDKQKTTDPEPLECWGFVSNDIFQGYIRREEAKRMDVSSIHMRQVTAQDEQDRKDAARFRRLMEMDGVGWQEGGEGWTALVPGRVLREAIDKEMEDK